MTFSQSSHCKLAHGEDFLEILIPVIYICFLHPSHVVLYQLLLSCRWN